MAKLSLWLDDRRLKNDGKAPLKIRYSENQKSRYLRTDIFLRPADWDAANARVRRTYGPEFKSLNFQLAELLDDYAEKMERGVLFDDVTRKNDPSIMDYLTELNNKRGKGGQYSSKGGRWLFTWFPNSGLPDNPKNWKKTHLEKADDYFDKNVAGTSYRQKICTVLVSILKNAFEDHECGFPINLKKLKSAGCHEYEARMRAVLTVEEIAELCYICIDLGQSQNLNEFLWSFFLCGANMQDVMEAIKNESAGKYFFERKKTVAKSKISRKISILESFYTKQAEKIGTWTHHTNYYRNFFLKSLCNQLYGKEITMYCARHTWGTAADQLGIDTETIAKALGHDPARITDLYLRDHFSKTETASKIVADAVEQAYSRYKEKPRKNLSEIVEKSLQSLENMKKNARKANLERKNK